MKDLIKFKKMITENKTNKEIAKALGVCAATIARTKKRFGIDDSQAKKRCGRKGIFGKMEN